MATVAALFLSFDRIVATSPQFFTAVAGYVVSFLKRRPWIMEVRDLWPESIRAVGVAKGSERWLDYMERLELFLYHRAERVVVVTEAFRENLVRRGVPPQKVAVVTNGVLLDAFVEDNIHSGIVPDDLRHTLAGKTVVSYIGTHGMAHKLDFIIENAAAAGPDIHFLFIGGGACKEELERQARQVSNVTMLPPIPKEAIPTYLSLVDIALIPLRRSDTFKTVIPSKIFESAAMRKPILLGVEGEARQIVETYGAGLAFTPEDRTDFLRQLGHLANEPELYARCREGCAALARAYDRRILAQSMLELIERPPERV